MGLTPVLLRALCVVRRACGAERVYFKLGQPIDTAALNLNLKDTAAASKLYLQVKGIVEQVRAAHSSCPGAAMPPFSCS